MLKFMIVLLAADHMLQLHFPFFELIHLPVLLLKIYRALLYKLFRSANDLI